MTTMREPIHSVLDAQADAFLAQHDGSAPVTEVDDRPDSEEQRTQNLWRACLLMVYSDARYRDGKSNEMNEGDCAEARRWLLSDLSPWKEDRDAVAMLCGYESGAFIQAKARKFLEPYLKAEAVGKRQRHNALNVEVLRVKPTGYAAQHPIAETTAKAKAA